MARRSRSGAGAVPKITKAEVKRTTPAYRFAASDEDSDTVFVDWPNDQVVVARGFCETPGDVVGSPLCVSQSVSDYAVDQCRKLAAALNAAADHIEQELKKRAD